MMFPWVSRIRVGWRQATDRAIGWSLSHQRRGIGTLLMRHLAAVARKQECSRIEWTTDRDNAAAQKFYERLIAPINRGKIMYRLESDAIASLAL